MMMNDDTENEQVSGTIGTVDILYLDHYHFTSRSGAPILF